MILVELLTLKVHRKQQAELFRRLADCGSLGKFLSNRPNLAAAFVPPQGDIAASCIDGRADEDKAYAGLALARQYTGATRTAVLRARRALMMTVMSNVSPQI